MDIIVFLMYVAQYWYIHFDHREFYLFSQESNCRPTIKLSLSALKISAREMSLFSIRKTVSAEWLEVVFDKIENV